MLLDVSMRRKRSAKPARKEVTAARSPGVDFAHLKQQVPLARVQLGLTARLRGNGLQRRGPKARRSSPRCTSTYLRRRLRQHGWGKGLGRRARA
jgi:hypothetical protein